MISESRHLSFRLGTILGTGILASSKLRMVELLLTDLVLVLCSYARLLAPSCGIFTLDRSPIGSES